MKSLLNRQRPPVFCPGCAHENVVKALDSAFQDLGLAGEQIAIVSDIGCSGLFDTFFNTHAFHGLHGRALTYATGLKMSRPELTVVVTMGDGGLGIGGAHLLSTCRRNIDLTLLVLNNFNYGMTGGQCSSTTPQDAEVASGFLNRLEKPMDVCQVAGAAGAASVARVSAYAGELTTVIQSAIRFNGFSLLDIWGVCPGRFTKRNQLTPRLIAERLADLPELDQYAALNAREEYGRRYRAEAAELKPEPPVAIIEKTISTPAIGRQEIVLLGRAGQRIVTAGELLCLSGATAGLQASQKNDYPITVLRGHSVSEIVLSETTIGFTGIEQPSVVIALAEEGINRRRKMFALLDDGVLIIKAAGLSLPECRGRVVEIDFKGAGIKPADWALASLVVMASQKPVLNGEMLQAALKLRFRGNALKSAVDVTHKAEKSTIKV